MRDPDEWRWLWEASNAAAMLWDDQGWRVFTARSVHLARDLGALSVLPVALSTSANERLFAGDFASVAALATEAQLISEAVGSRLGAFGAMALAAMRGDEREALLLSQNLSRDLAARGEGSGNSVFRWAVAVLYNGLGRYERALSAAVRTQRPAVGRAHLIYGEWLRRQRCRDDARDQLRRAYALLTEIGMAAFARRARAELEATGERADQRASVARDRLPQEAQIARLAASGGTNSEIAVQMLISPNTVAYHLRKVFAKLGLTTRHQLAAQLAP